MGFCPILNLQGCKLPFNNKFYVGYSNLRTQDGTGQFINDYCMFNLNDDDRDDETGLFKITSTKINNKIKNYIDTSNFSTFHFEKLVFHFDIRLHEKR
jgi:hypothetical protein